MRQFIITLILGMMLTLLSACNSGKNQREGPVFPGAGVTPSLKEMLATENPSWSFGQVNAVLPNNLLASVSGIPQGKAKVGDTVIFYAGNQVVNIGKVVRIVDGDLHVEYETPSDSRRHVLVNDLAALPTQKN